MKALWALGLMLAFQASAAIDTYQFKSEQQEQQFRDITAQLRCPKCQNNSIADSNAMIAADMRLKVYELQQQGQSRQQIIDYMVARYGNFVTYQPPLTPATLILWVLPALFIFGGGVVIVRRTRKRSGEQENGLDAAQQARLNQLLNPKGRGNDTAD